MLFGADVSQEKHWKKSQENAWESVEVSLWWQPLLIGFDELLIKETSVTINQRNLHFLAAEMFKVKNGMSTGLTELFF